MKKFIYSILAFMFVLPLAFALAGCKNEEPEKQLTNADFVGTWYVESEDYTYGETHEVYTCARLKELHDAGQTSEDEYVDLETYIYMYKVREDGTIQWKQYYSDESDYEDAGTWIIANNQLLTRWTLFGQNMAVEYDGSKIIVTVARIFAEKLETHVYTLAKVAA